MSSNRAPARGPQPSLGLDAAQRGFGVLAALTLSACSASGSAVKAKGQSAAAATPSTQLESEAPDDADSKPGTTTGRPTPGEIALPEPDGAAEVYNCDTEPGLSKMLQAERGRGLARERACVARPATFPGLILVGDFAYDRGCAIADYVRDCKLLDKAPSSQDLLLSVGWAASDAPSRLLLAKAYFEEIDMSWGEQSIDEPDPQSWDSDPDGGVSAELWISKTSGRSPGSVTTKVKLRFAPDGSYTRTQLAVGHRTRD